MANFMQDRKRRRRLPRQFRVAFVIVGARADLFLLAARLADSFPIMILSAKRLRIEQIAFRDLSRYCKQTSK